MGLVVLEGLLITVLVLTGFRKAVFEAIPPQLKTAIAVGIGFFLTIIGLADAGVIRPGNPLITFGVGGQLAGWPLLVFVVGLLLMAVLVVRKVKGALLIGIVATTLLAIVIEAIADVGARIGRREPARLGPAGARAARRRRRQPRPLADRQLLAVRRVRADRHHRRPAHRLLDHDRRLLRHGRHGHRRRRRGRPARRGQEPAASRSRCCSSTRWPPRPVARAASRRTRPTSRAPPVSPTAPAPAWPASSPACCSSSRCSSRRWSQMVPSEAAAPALVIVGALMITQIRYLTWDDMSLVIPAFLTIALMPFTYSITNGIGAGVVSFVRAPPGGGPPPRHPPADVGDRGRVRRLLRAGAHPAARLRGGPVLSRLRTVVPRTTLDTAALAHDLRLAVMRFSRRLRQPAGRHLGDADPPVGVVDAQAARADEPGRAGRARAGPAAVDDAGRGGARGHGPAHPQPAPDRRAAGRHRPDPGGRRAARRRGAGPGGMADRAAGASCTDEERTVLREAATIMEKLAGR